MAFGRREMAIPAAGLAVEIERFAVGLGAELNAADVADSGDLSAICGIYLDDDVLEFRRIVEAASEV